MTIDIIMPQMGESVAEGTILKWLVHEGDYVEKEQPLVEISTDKIDTEIPSPSAGIIKKILYKEGAVLAVQTVIAQIEEGEIKAQAGTVRKEQEEKERVEISETAAIAGERDMHEKRYSPLVKKLAKEYNVSLPEIKGSGEFGRVTKKDIMEYISSRQEITASKEKIVKEAERETLIPLHPKRKITAERMALSRQTAALVTTVFEVDMTPVTKYRELNREAMKREGIHLTYLPFIAFAVVQALKEHAALNSSWTDNGILQKNYINLGIAVALEDGLVVPVIKDADKKDMFQLAREIQEIAVNARSKKLKPDDVQGGTFTITNYGVNGSLFGTPLILQPQSAILGVGAVVKRPVILGDADAIAVRSMVYLSLSFDHRVMDGAHADAFLHKVKNILETWGVSLYEQKKPNPPGGYGGIW
ncbi:dihydrolipoamide acetyltransferase family protein [Candidatus Kuenenia sp.]|uniref:dihydrolipoamide acetyltransferase family protein n=1 Tax=Candidatus Kuenenia sp. TaxID=2499824 RepID=UPI0032202450